MPARSIALVCAMTLAVLAAATGVARATSMLSLSAAGDSAYLLQGIGIEKAAAFDITVTYNAAVLSSPQVTQGPLISGAMMQVNPNVPGTVRIGIIRTTPVSGSGTIATLSFTRISAGQGILNVAARLSDLSGKPLQSAVQLPSGSSTQSAGAQPVAQSPASQPAAPVAAPPATTTGAAGIGPLLATAPSPSSPTADNPDTNVPAEGNAVQQPSSSPETASQKAAPPSDGKRAEAAKTKTVYSQPPVLDRFRDLRGTMTPAALTALFDQEPLMGFVQYPAIILSDGVRTITVRFISTPDRDKTTDLAVMGARMISAVRDPDASNTWIVTLLPDKDTDAASLTVPQKNLLMIFPITVARKADVDIDHSGAVNETDFRKFLNDRGTDKTPKYDLNHDGVRDYKDDYIFTANYLVVPHSAEVAPPPPPAQPAPEEKKPRPLPGRRRSRIQN